MQSTLGQCVRGEKSAMFFIQVVTTNTFSTESLWTVGTNNLLRQFVDNVGPRDSVTENSITQQPKVGQLN